MINSQKELEFHICEKDGNDLSCEINKIDKDNLCKFDNSDLFIDIECISEDNYFENNKKKVDLKENMRKCSWRKDEEKRLLELKKIYPNDWELISSKFENKTKAQCYAKYSKLITNFKKGKWTKEEDNLVLLLIKKFKLNWKLISSNFKDRSLTQIKQRYFNCLDPNINRIKFSQRRRIINGKE